MPSTITKPRRRETKNTDGLPQGEALRREIRDWFRLQRKAVAKWLKSGGRIERKDLGDLPDTFPDWDWFGLGSLEMSERMTPRLEAIWDRAGQQFTSRIGLDPDSWEVTNPKTQEAIQRAALAFCQETNATTSFDLATAMDRVRKALAKNLIEPGGGIPQLSKEIARIFDGAEKWRARRIAVTEASRAVHQAQELQAQESGVVTGWEALISEDACPMCQTIGRRAQFVKLGQPFAIIGNHPEYSKITSAPFHPNCQCTTVPVLDIDNQPKWAATLHDPEPEEQDYAEGEYPGDREKPEPEVIERPKPKPVARPIPAAPVKPRVLTPSGLPVGDAIEVVAKDGKIKDHAESTIGIIDSIHGDGKLEKIPLLSTKNGVNEGTATFTSSGKPLGISIHEMASTPRITIAHEIGHQLDYGGIPRLSTVSVGGTVRDYDKDLQFREWKKAINESEAVKRLKSRVGVESFEVDGIPYKADQKFISYLNRDEEIWARSYSQYIATKSGDKQMLAELDSRIESRQVRAYGDHWSHEDFKPIMKAIDGMMKDLRWVK